MPHIGRHRPWEAPFRTTAAFESETQSAFGAERPSLGSGTRELRSLIGRVPLYEGTQLTSARTQRRPLGCKRVWVSYATQRKCAQQPPVALARQWRPLGADVRHMARPPGPRRCPPALRPPWGHAPPVWRPGGPCRRRHDAAQRPNRPPGRGRRPPHMATADPHKANPRVRGGCSLSLTPHRTPLAH